MLYAPGSNSVGVLTGELDNVFRSTRCPHVMDCTLADAASNACRHVSKCKLNEIHFEVTSPGDSSPT